MVSGNYRGFHCLGHLLKPILTIGGVLIALIVTAVTLAKLVVATIIPSMLFPVVINGVMTTNDVFWTVSSYYIYVQHNRRERTLHSSISYETHTLTTRPSNEDDDIFSE